LPNEGVDFGFLSLLFPLMNLCFQIVFRATSDATEHAHARYLTMFASEPTFTRKEVNEFAPAVLMDVGNAAMDKMLFQTLQLSPKDAPPIAYAMYCAGMGCPKRLFAEDTATLPLLLNQEHLSASNFYWDPVEQKPLVIRNISLLCSSPDCVQNVRESLNKAGRELRDSAHAPRAYRRACVVCNKPDTPEHPWKRCGKCQVPAYCGPECQSKNWAAHKVVCKKTGKKE
jgi:hypothetical protein